MRVRRHLTIACLILASVSCGGDNDPPPTAPSSPPTPIALTIVATAPSIGVGESQQLRAVVTYSDGSGVPATDVSWLSSNDAVYAVWPGGLVVAMAPGAATISATSAAFTARTTLTVERRNGDLRRVQGRVLDFASQTPMAGATLRFQPNLSSAFVATATTDASGTYVVDLPAGAVNVSIDDRGAGQLTVRLGGPAYRADLFGNPGACLGRYGVVIDAETFRPIAGATVRYGGGESMTGPDGWYRIDHPCVGAVSGNTITIRATHPAYAEAVRFTGRGLMGLDRLDLEMRRP